MGLLPGADSAAHRASRNLLGRRHLDPAQPSRPLLLQEAEEPGPRTDRSPPSTLQDDRRPCLDLPAAWLGWRAAPLIAAQEQRAGLRSGVSA